MENSYLKFCEKLTNNFNVKKFKNIKKCKNVCKKFFLLVIFHLFKNKYSIRL